MATGSITRFPVRDIDGSISVPRTIKDENGNLITITESITDANSTDSIETKPTHIVDISDQLSTGKYIYNFVNSDNVPTAASSVCRVYYNGVNFSNNVIVSEDRYTFSFPETYPQELFSSDNTLTIDFEEK